MSKSNARQIDAARQRLRALETAPGPTSREAMLERLRLQADLVKWQAKADMEAAATASILFEAYLRNGSMRAVRPGVEGAWEGKPDITGNPVQDLQNVYYHAFDMAEWANEYPRFSVRRSP